MFVTRRPTRWFSLWLVLSLVFAPVLQTVSAAAPSTNSGHAAHHAAVAPDSDHGSAHHPQSGGTDSAQHATPDCDSHDGCSALCCIGCVHHAGAAVVPLPTLGIDHPLMMPRVPQFHPDSLVLPREHPPRLLSV